MKRGIY